MTVQHHIPGRVDIRGLSISLGEHKAAFEAVQALDCRIEPGQFVCVLGRQVAASRPCSAPWPVTCCRPRARWKLTASR